MLWLLLACSSPKPTFVDGTTPIVQPPGTPVGHYLGPAGVVASGVLEDGAVFVLVDHVLRIGRGCAAEVRRHGEPVADAARSMTVVEAPGWTGGALGAARWYPVVSALQWACGDHSGVQVMVMPGQPTIAWDEGRVGVVESFTP